MQNQRLKIEEKILSLEHFLEKKSGNKKIVFTNGCFDILHLGHIDYLSKASEYGDILVVALNTDDSVKRLKGKHRPIQDEKSRARILASLFFVDYVILFDEDTPYTLINKSKPDVLIKGSDDKKEEIVGYEAVSFSFLVINNKKLSKIFKASGM
jgi:rfaE bifunctional protein nucleotidyltransferase chain/domain